MGVGSHLSVWGRLSIRATRELTGGLKGHAAAAKSLQSHVDSVRP